MPLAEKAILLEVLDSRGQYEGTVSHRSWIQEEK